MQQFHFRYIQIPRWKIILGAALLFALVLGLIVLALGVFLLALPVIVIGGVLAYFFGGRFSKPAAPDGIIEAEYREITPREPEQDRK